MIDLGCQCLEVFFLDHGPRDAVDYALVKWSACHRIPGVKFPRELGTHFIDPLKGRKAELTLLSPEPVARQSGALTAVPPCFKFNLTCRKTLFNNISTNATIVEYFSRHIHASKNVLIVNLNLSEHKRLLCSRNSYIYK